MGILSLGVEASNLAAKEALWINEAMRKIYPSSGRQLREGRAPHRFWLTIEQDGREETIVDEGFDKCRMMGFQPPLSAIIRSLIYFLNYDKYEYEQLLDERMIVYSYLAIDPSTVPADFIGSESCQVLLSRFLYVDNLSDNYRYEPDFTREQMNSYVYRRWAHEGTYYGFTSYSNVTLALGVYDRGEHVSQEGFLIHRMFDTRYYLMAIVGLLLPRQPARFCAENRPGLAPAVSRPGGRRHLARQYRDRQRAARRIPPFFQLLVLRGTGEQGRGDRTL
jgi:hypothetical protein